MFFPLVCSPGTYKEGVGDELCMPCPLHSTATFSGSVECQCDNKYFRSPKDPKAMPCTGKWPLKVLISIVFFNSETVCVYYLFISQIPNFINLQINKQFIGTIGSCKTLSKSLTLLSAPF